MKRRLKLATLLASSFALCSPTIAMMASCSKTKTYDDIARSLKDSVIDEFKWICPHYRNTFQNKWFCDMLTRHIEKMNPNYRVVKGTDYVPVEGQREGAYGYNMYFDIPSNDDTLEPIILQAHTDMVCAAAEDYDWTQGVIPEIEGNTMHSKDHKTSLGADDGIGVATMLAIAKHPNLFRHGRIRCLFTVDEEDGDSGMKSIADKTPKWFDGFNYLLNLDSENVDISWTSSGGCQQAKFEYKSNQTTELKNPLYLDVNLTNFAGGHSALVLVNNILNPVKVMGQVLLNIAKSYTVRLVGAYECNSPTDKVNGGTVPDEMHFRIVVGHDSTTPTVADVKDLIDAIIDPLKQSHPNDNKVTVSVSETKTEEKPAITDGITAEDTTKIATLAADQQSGMADKLFGIYSFIDEEHKYVKTCCNIGGFRLGKGVTQSKDANTMYFEVFGRSTEQSDIDNFLKTFDELAKKAGFTALTDTFVDIGNNHPWPYSPDNKMTKQIVDAAAAFELKMITEPVVGWLELGEIPRIRPDMQMGSLGPTIKHVHKEEETLYLDTLEPMFKLVVHIIQNIKKGA